VNPRILIWASLLGLGLLAGLGFVIGLARQAGVAATIETETRRVLDAAFEIQHLVNEAQQRRPHARLQLAAVHAKADQALARLRGPLGGASIYRWMEAEIEAVVELERRLFARTAPNPVHANRLSTHLYELTATAGMLHAEAIRNRSRVLSSLAWSACGFLALAILGLGLLALTQARAERRNARHARELASVNARMRGYIDDLEQYIYATSHDLKEPLRMVSQHLDLLRLRAGERLDARCRGFLAQALGGATRMHGLLDDLLRLTVLERGQATLEAFEAGAEVAAVVGMLGPRLEEMGGTVHAEPLPAIVADRGGFGQVVQNLVVNALKYRQAARPPRVTVRAEDGGDAWVFAIADNGQGFAAEHAEEIFRLFKRLHGSEYEGTGAGLAICRKIVARWGGRIWAESEPGVGSVFRFTVPKRGLGSAAPGDGG
jgi:signal transduction histidine kinase